MDGSEYAPAHACSGRRSSLGTSPATDSQGEWKTQHC
jgi:hypothetical protein